MTDFRTSQRIYKTTIKINLWHSLQSTYYTTRIHLIHMYSGKSSSILVHPYFPEKRSRESKVEQITTPTTGFRWLQEENFVITCFLLIILDSPHLWLAFLLVQVVDLVKQASDLLVSI